MGPGEREGGGVTAETCIGFMVMDDGRWERLMDGDVVSVTVYESQANAAAIAVRGEHVASVDFADPRFVWQRMDSGALYAAAGVVLDSDGSLRAVNTRPTPS